MFSYYPSLSKQLNLIHQPADECYVCANASVAAQQAQRWRPAIYHYLNIGADMSISANLQAASADVYHYILTLLTLEIYVKYASHIHSTNYTLHELIHLH